MGGLQPWHWLIVIAIFVLLFGAKKLPDAARSLGKSMRIFKSEIKEMQSDGKTEDEAVKRASELIKLCRTRIARAQADVDKIVTDLESFGPADAIADDVRKAMADTVVRRGETPMPVRYMLPLELSESLVTRLRARAEQMVAEQAADSTEAPQPPQPVARRSEQGSAMQQLRTITGG